jgi:NADPH2:quinone reductase
MSTCQPSQYGISCDLTNTLVDTVWRRYASCGGVSLQAIQVSQYGPADVLNVVDLPDLKPAAQQVRVDIQAAGVNPVDTYHRAGTNGYNRPLPFVPGSDGAGTVSEIGSEITDFNVGERVYVSGSITGTYATQCLCNSDQVFRLPDSLTFEQGAAIWVNYATAYRALFQRGGARAEERVLVHGATGGVGIAALQWAKLRGLEVTGTYGSEKGKKLLESFEIFASCDHSATDHTTDLTNMYEETGFDLIVEMLANVNLDADLSVLRSGGRVVVVGNRGTIEINPRKLMTNEADVRGVMLFHATKEERIEIHRSIAAGARSGVIAPVIREIFPFEKAAEAHDLVIAGGSAGKIILKPR